MFSCKWTPWTDHFVSMLCVSCRGGHKGQVFSTTRGKGAVILNSSTLLSSHLALPWFPASRRLWKQVAQVALKIANSWLLNLGNFRESKSFPRSVHGTEESTLVMWTVTSQIKGIHAEDTVLSASLKCRDPLFCHQRESGGRNIVIFTEEEVCIISHSPFYNYFPTCNFFFPN